MVKNIEKYNAVLKEYYDKIPSRDKIFYEELANNAISLGYYPTRDKTKSISISFRNNKVKYTIMKYTEETKNEFIWKFKFAANKKYSKIFEDMIKKHNELLIHKYSELYGFKNNFTCCNCKNCGNKKKLFYSYNHDDGKKYIVCSSVFFIHIDKISKEIVVEANELMKMQHNKMLEE